MKPQYVRLVLSQNKNLQFNSPLQNTHQLQVINSTAHHQNSSYKILKGITYSTTGNLPPRILLAPPSATSNLSNEMIQQTIKGSTAHEPVQKVVSEPFNPVDLSSVTAGLIETSAVHNSSSASPSNLKRTSSVSNLVKQPLECLQPTPRPVRKKTMRKVKLEETDLTVIKRNRNWAPAETITFIEVWGDHYDKLNAGGSRNTPIYNTIAKKINEILVNRTLNGFDVKNKIGNLTTEYRKRKKDQNKTGASPSSWPFYELLDKLLGQRPYNDDSLLCDSMETEDEQLLNYIENVPVPDLKLTQFSEQVEDNMATSSGIDESTQRSVEKSLDLSSPSHATSTVKSISPDKTKSTTKKNITKKKKRASEIKIDLLQDILGRLDNVNELASRSEVKVLELLQKQTKLQEESVQNEREFLNVFKTIATNMSGNR